MNCVVRRLRSLNLTRCRVTFLNSASVSTTPVALSKERKNPNSKNELPEPIRTSWGRMVYRGMLPKEPPKQYTTDPVSITKTGGRGRDGRIEIGRIGGGKPIVWHMVDLHRLDADESDPRVEVVQEITPEQTRSAFIALVAGGEKKRWIVATDNMEVGDIIKSTRELPSMPIQAKPGDAHPVGALALGTMVCCVERKPGEGSKVANAAGGSIPIVRKVNDTVVLKMPSKREMIVHESAMCVVGKVSNTERNKIDYGKAGAKRWLGIRPKSGLWKRKTGLSGRKIKPIPKPRMYTAKELQQDQEVINFTVDRRHFEKNTHSLHGLM